MGGDSLGSCALYGWGFGISYYANEMRATELLTCNTFARKSYFISVGQWFSTEIVLNELNLNGSMRILGDSQSLFLFQLPPTFDPTGALATFSASGGSPIMRECN